MVHNLPATPAFRDERPDWPISASLWPMLKTTIFADRGDRYPRGVSYRVLDLALDRLIAVNDLHELDPNEFPGK
jgi:hypothetical protein